MNKDTHLMFEAYTDGLTQKKAQLGSHIMSMVKHGVPEEKDIPNIKMKLTNIFTAIKQAGSDKITPEQEQTARGLIAQLRNTGMSESDLRDIYRHAPSANSDQFKDQMPDSREEYSAHDYAKEMEMRGEDAEESKHPLGNVREVPARDLKPGDVLSLFKNTVIKIDDMAPRLIKGKVRVTYKDVRGVVHNVDLNKSTKITVNNVPQEDGEEGDLMKHMKDQGMIDPKATDDTGKYGRHKEEEEHCADEDEQRRLDPTCWKGYHKSGTKTKSGVRVNNCVKN